MRWDDKSNSFFFFFCNYYASVIINFRFVRLSFLPCFVAFLSFLRCSLKNICHLLQWLHEREVYSDFDSPEARGIMFDEGSRRSTWIIGEWTFCCIIVTLYISHCTLRKMKRIESEENLLSDAASLKREETKKSREINFHGSRDAFLFLFHSCGPTGETNATFFTLIANERTNER